MHMDISLQTFGTPPILPWSSEGIRVRLHKCLNVRLIGGVGKIHLAKKATRSIGVGAYFKIAVPG